MTEADENKVVSIREKTNEVVFHADPYERQRHTVRGVADLIIQHAPSLKGKRKWLEATIKRLVHAEKHSVYSRVKLFCGDEVTEGNKFFLDQKIEMHFRLADAPDDEVVTWD